VNVGIFGGTFDPPHLGHLIAAQDACAALSLDRLLFVPAAEPPHKDNERVTSALLRLEMLHAAIADNSTFEISTIELDRSGPSYTVDTLRQLHAERPGDRLFLLLGYDQVRAFGTWHEPEEVLRLAENVMLARIGGDRTNAAFVQQTVSVTRIDISSTLVRARQAAGESVRYLVPEAVAKIIEREGLYRKIASAAGPAVSR